MATTSKNQKNKRSKELSDFLKDFLPEGVTILQIYNDEECDCPDCQQHRWEKDDRIMSAMKFEEGKSPTFVLFLKHHRKVERLIGLRETFIKANEDLPLWKKIIEDHDLSTFGDLSDGAQEWLRDVATDAIKEVMITKKPGYQEAIGAIFDLRFIDLVAGNTSVENEVINKFVGECRKEALKDDTPKIQGEIDAILDALTKEYHDATEIPTLEIPLEELEEALQSHLSKKKAK